jgi:uncharacterized repeat protein (TIGR01451 family)
VKDSDKLSALSYLAGKLLFPVLVLFCLPLRLSAACGVNLCTDTWTFNGSATAISSNEFQLTQNTSWETGSVWDNNKVDLTVNFDYTFQEYFGATGGASGADGIIFVLQNQSTLALGNAGGQLGFAGLPPTGGPVGDTITPSVGIEVDTFQNNSVSTPNTNDPAFDHIMVDENGNVVHTGNCTITNGTITTASGTCPVQASATQTDVKDNAWHMVEYKWTAATHVLQVYFDGSLRLTYTKDIATYIFGGQTCAYLGFTSATGVSKNDHRVRLNNCITPTPSPTITRTFTVTLTNTPTPPPPPTLTAAPTVCGTPVKVSSASLANGCYSTSNSLAFTNPGGNNLLLIVRIEEGSGASPTSVSYAGSPMTLLRSDVDYSSPGTLKTYYLVGPPIGAYSVVVNYASASCSWNIEAELYSGVNQSSPIGASSTTTGSTGGVFNTTITTTGVASLVSDFLAIAQVSSITVTLGTGQVNHGFTTGCCEEVYGDYMPVGPAGTYQLWYTLSQSKNYTSQLIEIKGNLACPTTPTPTPASCGGAGQPTLSQKSNIVVGSGCYSTGNLISFNNTGGSNTLMVVRIENGSSNSVLPSAISYNSVNLNFFRQDVIGYTTGNISTYYLVAPATGANNLVINFASGSCTYNVEMEIWTNVNQVTPMGAGSTANVSSCSSSFSTTITTTGSNSAIDDYLAIPQVVSGGVTVTLGGGQTTHSLGSNCCEEVYGDDKYVGAAGAQTMTYTLSQCKNHMSQLIEIQGMSACSSPTPTPTYSKTLTMTLTSTSTSTPTPSMPLSKNSNVSTATLGDTVTYCLNWNNNSNSAQTMIIWDTLSTSISYLGCDNGCTKAGQLLNWNLGSKASGSNGSVCVWGTVVGYGP